MKNPLFNWFTDDEQKIILFLVIFGFLGMIVHYSGLIADENESAADSLKIIVQEDYQIQYDLRTVTQKELITIPGIGSKRAEDIIKYRDENGFTKTSDLKNVKGIGDATYLKISKYLIPFGKETSKKEKEVEINTIKDTVKSNKTNKININTATKKDFMTIKGIGPSKAQKIIDLRNQLGEFTSLEQLLEVKGIGKKTLEKMRPYLCLQ